MGKEADKVYRVLISGTGRDVGRLTLNIWQALTFATPVATGFARSAYFPSLGSGVSGELKAPGDEAAAAAAAKKQLAANRARAQSIAAGYRLDRGPVHIANPVVYIVPLMVQGTSAQAGPNAAERAIEAAVRKTEAESKLGAA